MVVGEITNDRDYKSGKSVITERLYIDVKYNLKNKIKSLSNKTWAGNLTYIFTCARGFSLV